MSEIAFNINGEPFDPAPTQAAWRIRKLKPKGAPEVVYGRDGLPLFLPMDADLEDLRREAPAPTDGKYRLDPVDEHNRPVLNSQSSYVCLHPVVREPAPEPAAPTVSAAEVQAEATTKLVNALLESQKQHTELARMYVSQFPVLVNALSAVVRSAGDAGLPARVPLVVPIAPEATPAESSGKDKGDEDEEGDDDDSADGDEEPVVEVVEAAPESSEDRWLNLGNSVLKIVEPYLGPLLGTLTGKLTQSAPGATTAADAGPVDVGAHLAAIRAAMPPDEVELGMKIVDELPLAEKLAYVNKLRTMSVPEAVAYLRAELARRQATPERELSEAEIDAHVAAIHAALTPEESQALQLLLEELPFELRVRYLRKLGGMSVLAATAHAQRELAELGRDFVLPRRPAAPRTASPSTVRPAGDAPSTAPAAQPPRHTASNAPETPRRAGLHIVRAPVDEQPAPAPTATRLAGSPASATAPGGSIGLLSPATQAHIVAIQGALTAEEDAAMRTYFAALSSADRSAWVGTLLMLPVPEAVAAIRAQLAAARSSDARPGMAISATPSADATAATPPVSEAAPRNLASVTSAPIVLVSPEGTAPQPDPPAEPAAPTVPADPKPTDTATTTVATPTAPVAAAPPLPDVATVPVGASADAPARRAIDAHQHLAAIESTLAPEERLIVYAMVGQMSPAEREVWLDQLVSVSVADGVARLRDAINSLITQERPIPEPPSGAPIVRDLPSDDGEQPDDSQAFDPDDETEDGEPLDADESPEDSEAQGDGEAQGDSHEHDGSMQADATRSPDRDAAPSGHDREGARSPEARPPAAVVPPSDDLPTLDEDTMTHLRTIEHALGFAERMRLLELAARRPAAELRGWIAELSQLPVPEAVAKLRAALAEADTAAHAAKKGGVS